MNPMNRRELLRRSAAGLAAAGPATILESSGSAGEREGSGSIGERSVLLASGADVRGVVYAALELADRAAYAGSLQEALRLDHPLIERPSNPVRSVARFFVSDVEDKPWFHDRDFWVRYLS